NRLFESEDIVGCLCADDLNPYTRIPLLLAHKRGIPTLACHHGALAYGNAIKKLDADFYLAKSEMERDYLVRRCEVPAEKVVLGAPSSPQDSVCSRHEERTWLVFFTEPYAAGGWRIDEIYRELLPVLCSLAESSGLELVFKLHPFESVRGHRRLLRRHISRKPAERIRIIAGPPSAELWQKTRAALTVQSSVAVECTMRGIPVFLCGWLREPFAGYLRQFAEFGAGQIVNSAAELEALPVLLSGYQIRTGVQQRLAGAIEPPLFRALLRNFSGVQASAVCETASGGAGIRA
ncbi:MAG TPA: hypothetical protein VH744_13400, partial [Terriglobales bacterium]